MAKRLSELDSPIMHTALFDLPHGTKRIPLVLLQLAFLLPDILPEVAVEWLI